jgi:predicted dehydrogenase
MSDRAMKNVAIIGAGLQAKRRGPVIKEDPQFHLAAVVDRVEDRARGFVQQFGGRASTDWRPVVNDPAIDVVLVLTYPDSHADIAIAALEAGKDVLCEKPLTRTKEEARRVLQTVQTTGRILKCGFNHRHHPAVAEAYRLFHEGEIGKPVFGRGRYGIAGRQGLEKEWRSDPKIVSGGQLMEQGIHLVDLFRWFLGDFARVTGLMSTTRWPIQPLEDNGFVVMQNRDGVVVSIHSSLTQWINLFEFEIYGEKGSLTVQGLGSSYGVEKLIVNRFDPTGPFSHETFEYRGGDTSWKSEWQEFVRAMAGRSEPLGNALDGLRAMEIVNAAYTASTTGRAVLLD